MFCSYLAFLAILKLYKQSASTLISQTIICFMHYGCLDYTYLYNFVSVFITIICSYPEQKVKINSF